MIVQCQQCKKRFKLNPDLIKGPTAKVRCSQCRHIFTIEAPQSPQALAPEAAVEMAEPPRPARRRAGRLLFLLIPLVLIAATIAIWRYLPGLTPPESGSKHSDIELLHLVETRGYFIDNRYVGQLFVIEGRLRNDFPNPRRWIRLRARLYTADGRAAQQLDFYAGNLLTDQQLASMPLADLLGLIQHRPDPQERAPIIPAKEEVSFIVPFGDLPELSTLSDYSVEILASQPA